MRWLLRVHTRDGTCDLVENIFKMDDEEDEGSTSTQGTSSTSTSGDKSGLLEASDTFRRVLEQLNIRTDGPINKEDLAILDGVSSRRHTSTSDDDVTSLPAASRERSSSVCVSNVTKMTPDTLQVPPDHRRVRRKSVHWIDERSIIPIAHEPTPEQRHGARIFVKTVPKSILKSSHENIAIPTKWTGRYLLNFDGHFFFEYDAHHDIINTCSSATQDIAWTLQHYLNFICNILCRMEVNVDFFILFVSTYFMLCHEMWDYWILNME